MALSLQTQWEVRTTGSDTACSGGFNPNNANMATDGAATSATGNSPVFTSASYNFVAGDVGAKVFIQAGTNWNKGWYEIASVASNAATLKAAIGEAVVYAGSIATTNFSLQIATTVAGCATTASPTGATWTIDYSQQNAAQFSYTDLVSATTTTITSAAFPFGKNQVGNLIKITSGASWTVQTVEIVSVSSVTATVDKTVGGSGLTGGNGYQGGAYAGPQLIGAMNTNSNVIWVKQGAYSITAAGSNVANGKYASSGGNQCISMIGYNSTRGDDSATRPIFTCSASAAGTQFTASTISMFRNITIDGGGISGVNGFVGGDSSCLSFNCRFQNGHATVANGFGVGSWVNCTADTCGTGFTSSSGMAILCSAITCTTGFAKNAMRSVAKSCTTGFTGTLYSKCIAMTCTTGFSLAGASQLISCVSYNGTNGFVAAANGVPVYLLSCISTVNSSRGFDSNTGTLIMVNCAGWSNTTADVRFNSSSNVLVQMNTGFITLTSDPFVSASGGNFALTNTAGGGASLRGAAVNFAFPAIISSTTYEDYGAIQHQETASVGGGSFTFS